MKTKILLTAFLLLSSLSSWAQLPSYLPTNGLVAWYPFNGNANDESGNGYHGTVNGATLTTDRFGNPNQAYNFITGNRITSSPALPIGNSPRSVSVWFKTSSLSYNPNTGLNVNVILSYGNGPGTIGSGASGQLEVDTQVGILVLNHYATGLSNSTFVSDNIWHNVIYTYDGVTHKLFLDSQLIDQDSYPLNTGLTQLMFGGRAAEPNWHNFNGTIDDAAIWNRALTLQEVNSLYTGQAPCQNTSTSIAVSITEGETYNFNGQNLTVAGTYTATLQNAAGCDSVVTLNLTVEPAVEPLSCEITEVLNFLCIGESTQLTVSTPLNNNQQIEGLTFIGNLENSSYFIDYSNKSWTDASANAISLGGKLLVINDSIEDSFISALLPAGYFHIGLFQNTSSQNYSEPNGGWEWVDGTPLNYTRWGVLPQEPNNEFGVENFGGIHGSNFPYYRGWNDGQIGFNPSIIEINTIYPTSILWSTGETTPSITVSPTETTTYSVTVTQGNQTCTSEVTIAVNQPSEETINATITEGESYNFNGQNLTTAGTYTATLQNAAGCDSMVTLNLTVNPAPVAGCYAASVVSFNQGDSFDGTSVSAIRSNPELALGMPEPVVTNVVNFVSLGFGGSITLAFEAPIANGAGNDIRIDEATWNNNPCNRYPERADVFASQDGVNFVYLGVACQDASFDLGALSWAQYVRIVDISDLLSFSHGADGFDVNGIECLNGAATSLNDDGLVACSLQEIVSYTPGNRKNGTAVGSPRNNPANALGTPQNNNTINFNALGFGGTIVAKFDYVVFNQPGNDLRVTETSFGNPSCNNYPERARVSVSMDNVNWTELGEICQDGEIDLANVNYAQYIKIQDASPMSSNKFNGAADGYDVDAVVVLNNGCGTSSARLAQMDNTTTPDASMMVSAFPNPMEDYTVVNFEGLENDSDFNFQIIDAAGRVIRNQNIRVTASNPTYLFDASELARGIYQVIIANENGSNIIRLVK